MAETEASYTAGPEAHPDAPAATQVPISLQTRPPGQRICDYYLTKRGCSKGERCDFLHEGGSVNPSVENMAEEEKQLCSFYISDRGCVKEDRCEFAHPLAPNGKTSIRICEYFQQSRGCVKAERCDFLHVRAPSKEAAPGLLDTSGSLMEQAIRAQAHANQLAAAAGLMPSYGGAPAAFTPTINPATGGINKLPSGVMPPGPGNRPPAPTQGTKNNSTRVCDFYQTARGCAKQERCDFIHAGPTTPSDGASHYSQLTKAVQEPEAVVQQQQQQHMYSAYGMQPGQQYGYTYATDGTVVAAPMPAADGTMQHMYPAYPQPAYPTPAYPYQPAFTPAPAVTNPSNKVCTFFGTVRGCRKGARCDFIHPAQTNNAPGGAPAPTAKSSVRYSPY